MPSSDVLIALADGLCVSVDYLFGDPNLIMMAVEFRGNKLKSKRDIARIEAKVLHLSIGVFQGLSMLNHISFRRGPRGSGSPETSRRACRTA